MGILVRAADGINYVWLSAVGSGTEDDPFKSQYLVEQSGNWTVAVNNLPEIYPVSFNWLGLTNDQLRAAPLTVVVDSGYISLPADAATETKQQQIINKLDAVSSQLAGSLSVDVDVTDLAKETTVAEINNKLPQLTLQGDSLKVAAGFTLPDVYTVAGTVSVNNLPSVYSVDTGLVQPLTQAQLQAATVKVVEQNPTDVSLLAKDQTLSTFANKFAWQGDRIKVDANVTLPSSYAVTGNVSVSNLPAVQAVSGTVTANTGLLQPITLAQLQGITVKTQEQAPLDITGLAKEVTLTALNNKLSLSGDRIKVDANVTLPSTYAVTQSGPWNVNTGLSQGLTNTELRASPVTVGGTVELGENSLAALETINVTVSGSTTEITNDVGNPIPVNGTVNIGNFPSTQSVSGTVAVSNFPASVELGSLSLAALEDINVTVTNSSTEITNDAGNPIPVSGSIAVSNFPSSQTVTGTVTSNIGTGSLTGITNTVTVKADTLANQTNAFKVDGSAVTQPISGTVSVSTLPALPTGTNAIGSVSVSNFPSTQVISGTVTANTGLNPLTDAQLRASNVGTVVNNYSDLATLLASTRLQADVKNNVSVIGDLTLDKSGLATDTNQATTNTTLSTINGKIPSNLTVSSTRLLVDGSGVTQPVSPNITRGSGAVDANTQRVTLATDGPTVTSLSSIDTKTPTVGQKTSANSSPVVIASDQSAVPVSGTITANLGTIGTVATEATLSSINTKLTTATGRLLVDGSQVTQPISGSISVSNFPATQTVSGSVTANIGSGNLTGITSTVVIKADTPANQSNALKVDGSAVTQPVSGTVTVSQSTASNLNATVVGTGTFATQVTSLPSLPTGSNVIGSIANTSFAISGTLPAFASTPTVNLGTIAGIATETTLSSINTKLTTASGRLIVDGSQVTQPVNTGLSQPLTNAQLTSQSALLSNLEYSVSSSGLLLGKAAYLFTILGNRTAFANTTAFHDLCEFLSTGLTYTQVTTSDALEIVSTSASDTTGGTGTRSVKVTYLNNSGILTESPAIALNGTTPVAAGFTASAILWMEALEGGSSQTSVGTITLRNVATPTTIYEQITAGGNKSLSGRFTVPSNCTAYLLDYDFAAVSQTMDIRLRATCDSFIRVNNGDRFLFQVRKFLASGQNFTGDGSYLKYGAGTQIKVSAIPGATGGSPRADSNFTLLVVEN